MSDVPAKSPLAGIIPRTLARARRVTFLTLVCLGTLLGTWLMIRFLQVGEGYRNAKIGLLICFVPLFYQLNSGFWTALIGVWLQNRPTDDPTNLWNTIQDDDGPLSANTAIIIPVYNEDVTRVWEGLRVTFESLKKTGHLQHFDFFVLSDSDQTNKWIEEQTAWLELSRQLGAFGKIFYRHRRKPINRKSGNVSDFCRRWGKRYT